MSELIAYCGYDCRKCPIYIATIENDENMKEKLSRKYSRKGNILTVSDISCMGCFNDSNVLYRFCFECKIRKCGISHAFANCGECPQYPCELFKPVLERNRKILDEISKNRPK